MNENAALIESEDAIALSDHGAIFAEFVVGTPEGLAGVWIEAMESFVPTVEVDFAIDHDG